MSAASSSVGLLLIGVFLLLLTKHSQIRLGVALIYMLLTTSVEEIIPESIRDDADRLLKEGVADAVRSLKQTLKLAEQLQAWHREFKKRCPSPGDGDRVIDHIRPRPSERAYGEAHDAMVQLLHHPLLEVRLPMHHTSAAVWTRESACEVIASARANISDGTLEQARKNALVISAIEISKEVATLFALVTRFTASDDEEDDKELKWPLRLHSRLPKNPDISSLAVWTNSWTTSLSDAFNTAILPNDRFQQGLGVNPHNEMRQTLVCIASEVDQAGRWSKEPPLFFVEDKKSTAGIMLIFRGARVFNNTARLPVLEMMYLAGQEKKQSASRMDAVGFGMKWKAEQRQRGKTLRTIAACQEEVWMLHSLLKSNSKQLSEEYKFDQRVGWPELWNASVLVPEEQITLPACSVCKKRCHRKCQKCQLVFLCSKDCMTQIWSTHKQECKNANRTDNRVEVNLASVRPSPIRNGFRGSLAYGNAVAIAEKFTGRALAFKLQIPIEAVTAVKGGMPLSVAIAKGGTVIGYDRERHLQIDILPVACRSQADYEKLWMFVLNRGSHGGAKLYANAMVMPGGVLAFAVDEPLLEQPW